MADRIALNSATIKQAGLARTLEIARQVGYTGVGLWVDEVEQAQARGVTLPDLAGALADHELELAELCSVAGWMWAAGADKREALEAARHAFRAAEFLSCPWVAASASTGVGDLRSAAEDFAGLCDLAATFGVGCALEFPGGAAQVRDLKTAWQIVREAGRGNAGLLLDTFHFHKGGSSLADLRAVPAEAIALVQLSDCQDLPLGELEDAHRIFPGLGVIPLEQILGVLREGGYQGGYSLDLHNPSYWDGDAYVVALDGLRSLGRLGLRAGR
jgi:2-keto-myo-inositol isomerase